MKINSQFTWKNNNTRNNPLLPHSIRGLIIGKSNCGKTTLLLNLLLQPGWLDYNHLYVFGKSLHQREYQILKKGFEAGLSKTQISNIFKNQDHLDDPVQLIEAYSGEAKGEIKAEFYDDCKLVPDPTALRDRVIISQPYNRSLQRRLSQYFILTANVCGQTAI